jgi:hypothetical protein
LFKHLIIKYYPLFGSLKADQYYYELLGGTYKADSLSCMTQKKIVQHERSERRKHYETLQVVLKGRIDKLRAIPGMGRGE